MRINTAVTRTDPSAAQLMRGWSLQWRSTRVPEQRSGSFSAAAARRSPVLHVLVPPARRSRLMLHKYLRSRFAPGATRRKHHRERGDARQSHACSSAGCSSPSSIPGDPREMCQLTAAAFRFQRPRMRENPLLSRRTQASKTRALQPPAPLRAAAGRRCVSAFPGQRTPNLPRDQPRTKTGLWTPRSGPERARLSPLGPGADTGQRGHPRATTDNPSCFRLAPGHGEPDVSPRPACTAGGSPCTRPPTRLRVHYPTHKQPLPTRHHLPALRVPEAVLPPPAPSGNHKVSRERRGGRNTVCGGSIQAIFKLFHLESYLGSSEESRSPNAS